MCDPARTRHFPDRSEILRGSIVLTGEVPFVSL